MKTPKFYPGLALTAQHLIDLENYVLARHSVESNAHGVIKFQKPYCLNGKLVISELTGITPNGTLIIHSPEDQDGAIKFNLDEFTRKAITDFYIEFNQDKNIKEKYIKHCEIIQDQDIYPKKIESALYLGRYNFKEQSYECLQPPYFFHLNAASGFLGNEEWISWTERIRNTIRNLVQKDQGNEILSFKVSELVFNYNHWPLTLLFRKCYEFNQCYQMLTSGLSPTNGAAFFFSKSLVDETFMTHLMVEMLNLTDHSYRYLPVNLPRLITDYIGNSSDDRLWWLERREFTFNPANRTIKINRSLEGNNKICIRSNVNMGRSMFVSINGHDIIANSNKFEEFGVEKWDLQILYTMSENQPLSAGWTIVLKGKEQGFTYSELADNLRIGFKSVGN